MEKPKIKINVKFNTMLYRYNLMRLNITIRTAAMILHKHHAPCFYFPLDELKD